MEQIRLLQLVVQQYQCLANRGKLRQVYIILCSVNSVSLQCSDTVGWATGRHPACKKLGVGLLMVTI